MPQITLNGKLDAFWETGTEGVMWALFEDGREGYEALHVLHDGDRLTVFADAARETMKWQGTVKLEYERNWRSFPRNPQYGQQEVDGYWVHGLQEEMDPEEWSRMFHGTLPAQLTFEAIERVETFEGRLERYMITHMQAPSWKLKTSTWHNPALQTRDHLTVYEDDSKSKILWNGALQFSDINIRTALVFPRDDKQTTPEDIRAHIYPQNIDPDLWEDMIADERPAKLVRTCWVRPPRQTL